MTDKVLCPWCGAEMEMMATYSNYDVPVWGARMWCAKCTAAGPLVNDDNEATAKKAARAAALRRYEPPVRPMTLDEVKEHVTELEPYPLWLEDNDEPSNTGWIYGHIVRDWLDGYSEPYGYGWRCWPRKPTDEERKEAKWDD